MPLGNPFRPTLFKFLRDLARHNDREWFQEHKARYIEEVRDPSLAFVASMALPLEKVSPHLDADPRPVGGSLFRIHRDTRFSHDKSPYKTHVGLHFRHEQGKTAHAPGIYLHLQPRGSFLGVGIWHPGTPEARRLREAIVAAPERWRKAAHAGAFAKRFTLGGEQLARPPRGFDPDHPFVDDLRRKDFMATIQLSDEAVLASDFPSEFLRGCRLAAPFVGFLCEGLDLPF